MYGVKITHPVYFTTVFFSLPGKYLAIAQGLPYIVYEWLIAK